MTIDEAIKHCEDVAEEKESIIECLHEEEAVRCQQCATDHRQLAEWLRELKVLRGKIADICSILAAYYGCPCNHSPQDEIMAERGNCEDCGEISNAECWSRFLETEIQLDREGIQDNTNKMYAEIKDLREENKVLMQECDRLIKEKGELLKQHEQIGEYKRLLKSAVEDINWINVHTQDEDGSCIMRTNSGCSGCPLDINGDLFCKWKHNDEALALIGEDGENNA